MGICLYLYLHVYLYSFLIYIYIYIFIIIFISLFLFIFILLLIFIFIIIFHFNALRTFRHPPLLDSGCQRLINVSRKSGMLHNDLQVGESGAFWLMIGRS